MQCKFCNEKMLNLGEHLDWPDSAVAHWCGNCGTIATNEAYHVGGAKLIQVPPEHYEPILDGVSYTRSFLKKLADYWL